MLIKCYKNGKGIIRLIVLLYLFFFDFSLYSQTTNPNSVIKSKGIVLLPFEFVQLASSNGTQCICSIQNLSINDSAKIVFLGGPDESMFNNKSFLNGIHVLSKREQILNTTNYHGREVLILNATVKKVSVQVYFVCYQKNKARSR